MKNLLNRRFTSRLVNTFPLGFQMLLYIIVTILFLEKGLIWGLIGLILSIFFCFLNKISFGLLIILFLLGSFQFQEKIKNQNLVSGFYNKQIFIEGGIVNYPEINDSIKVEAKVKVDKINTSAVNSEIYFRLESDIPETKYKLFNRIKCSGVFQKASDYEKEYFLSEKLDGRIICKELSIVNSESPIPIVSSIVNYKSNIVQIIKNNLNQPYSELFLGMIFGDNSQMSTHLTDDIKNSGMAHIIAASGYNINLVVSLAFIPSKFIRRNKLIIISDVLLFIYLLFVGIDNVPAKRAIIMQLYLTTAWIFGKKANIFYSFLISILFLFLENIYAYKSLSFLLTFMATLGIIVFYKPLRDLLNRFIKDIWLCEAIAISVVSNLGSIPILVIFFGKISLISILSNILISPLIPIIFYLGFGYIILLSLGLQSTFLNFVIFCSLDVLIKVIDYFGGVSFATITFTPNIYLMLLIFLLIFILLLHNIIKRKYYEKNTINITGNSI